MAGSFPAEPIPLILILVAIGLIFVSTLNVGKLAATSYIFSMLDCSISTAVNAVIIAGTS